MSESEWSDVDDGSGGVPQRKEHLEIPQQSSG